MIGTGVKGSGLAAVIATRGASVFERCVPCAISTSWRVAPTSGTWMRDGRVAVQLRARAMHQVVLLVHGG